MQLADLVATSERVAADRSRKHNAVAAAAEVSAAKVRRAAMMAGDLAAAS